MKVSINDGQITKTVSYVQCQSLGNCWKSFPTRDP